MNQKEDHEFSVANESVADLLFLVRLGAWVLRGDERLESRYGAVLQEIYREGSRIRPGLFVERQGEWTPSESMEDLAYPVLEAYEEMNFWEELPVRLAGRDLVRENREGDEDRFEELVESYREIFTREGVLHLYHDSNRTS